MRSELPEIFGKTRRVATGFTLLEVMLSVTILVMMTLAVYNFVKTTVKSLKYSVEDTLDVLSTERIIAALQEELQNMPLRGGALLNGQGFKVGDRFYDQIHWTARRGVGLMTEAVRGECSVALQLKEIQKGSEKYEMGLLRRYNISKYQNSPFSPLIKTALQEPDPKAPEWSFAVRAGANKDETWLPLITGVKSLQIRYWDSRVNSLVDTWREPSILPALVILNIWREGEEVPTEVVLSTASIIRRQ